MIKAIGIALILVLTSPAANAGIGDRKDGIYGVLGLDRDFTTYKGDTYHSDFAGWGLNAEAGVDWVSTSDYGLNLAAIFHQGDDKNRSVSTDAIETGESVNYGAKAGFIVSALTIGGGFQKTDFKTKTLSAINGYSESEVTGQEAFGYVNLTFNIGLKYRSMVELTYGQGSAGGVSTRSTTISLKIGIIESMK